MKSDLILNLLQTDCSLHHASLENILNRIIQNPSLLLRVYPTLVAPNQLIRIDQSSVIDNSLWHLRHNGDKEPCWPLLPAEWAQGGVGKPGPRPRLDWPAPRLLGGCPRLGQCQCYPRRDPGAVRGSACPDCVSPLSRPGNVTIMIHGHS